MKGTVKFFNHTKGFGFITGEDKDYFVHHSALAEGVTIDEGDSVEFTPEESPKGARANDVKKTASAPPKDSPSGRDPSTDANVQLRL